MKALTAVSSCGHIRYMLSNGAIDTEEKIKEATVRMRSQGLESVWQEDFQPTGWYSKAAWPQCDVCRPPRVEQGKMAL